MMKTKVAIKGQDHFVVSDYRNGLLIRYNTYRARNLKLGITMKNKIIMGITLSVFMFGGISVSQAAESGDSAAAKITELKAKLKGKFRSEPTSVKESKLANIFEVMYGTEVVYFSADGKYFLAGDMIELESRENLSEIAKQSVRKDIMQKQDFKPVVFKAKDEKHKLIVFTDIDCGYCAKLHREMPEINAKGITVEYLMFPRAGLASNSFNKAVSMWCADDQQQSMTDAKERREIESKTCENPIEMQYNLGREVGVTGTPALVTATGKLIPGYMPADRLAAALDADAK